MRAQILLVCALVMIGSCATRQKPITPTPLAQERYLLQFDASPDAAFCVQQFSGTWDCIRVADLRRLLGTIGKA